MNTTTWATDERSDDFIHLAIGGGECSVVQQLSPSHRKPFVKTSTPVQKLSFVSETCEKYLSQFGYQHFTSYYCSNFMWRTAWLVGVVPPPQWSLILNGLTLWLDQLSIAFLFSTHFLIREHLYRSFGCVCNPSSGLNSRGSYSKHQSGNKFIQHERLRWSLPAHFSFTSNRDIK